MSIGVNGELGYKIAPLGSMGRGPRYDSRHPFLDLAYRGDSDGYTHEHGRHHAHVHLTRWGPAEPNFYDVLALLTHESHHVVMQRLGEYGASFRYDWDRFRMWNTLFDYWSLFRDLFDDLYAKPRARV
jgi:hypothetical protein